MLRFNQLVAAAAIALSVPGLAMAQAVSHLASGGRVLSETELAQATPLMPMVSPARLPLAALMRRNHAPLGVNAGVMPAGVDTQAYGGGSPTSLMPYDFERVFSGNYDKSYPARAAGQLSFTIGSSAYLCSASMIRPGILVTAAHCTFSYGANSQSGFYSGWVFYPARTGGKNPYGTWSAYQVWIPSVYYSGTDNCYQTGVICNNDLAVIIMNPNAKGVLAGNQVGWYGYGWNGYSFTTSFGGAFLAVLSQLGYPCAWDNCATMERDNGLASYWSPDPGGNQTLIGSAMTGGSSGGPWLANFGVTPTLTGSASLGNAANYEVVDAVTGWGYTTVGINTQGASWFGQNDQFPNASYLDKYGRNWGAGNIGSLVAAACSGAPSSSYC